MDPETLPEEGEIAALFQAYAEGFDDFDAESIAATFAFPATIWQSGKGHVFIEREEIVENVEALLAVFEREEIVHSHFEIVDCSADESSAYAVLDWRQEREDGEAALEFTCRYALVKSDAEPRWRIALAVND